MHEVQEMGQFPEAWQSSVLAPSCLVIHAALPLSPVSQLLGLSLPGHMDPADACTARVEAPAQLLGVLPSQVKIWSTIQCSFSEPLERLVKSCTKNLFS